jgi:hypothetical protein
VNTTTKVARTASGSVPGYLSLFERAPAGATHLVLGHPQLPPALDSGVVWVAINPYTTNCEVVQVTGFIPTKKWTKVSPALTKSHPAGSMVVVLDDLRFTPQLFGAVANGKTKALSTRALPSRRAWWTCGSCPVHTL